MRTRLAVGPPLRRPLGRPPAEHEGIWATKKGVHPARVTNFPAQIRISSQLSDEGSNVYEKLLNEVRRLRLEEMQR
jgi:hypothetical protein